MAWRPFLKVTVFGEAISLLFFSFTQYAFMPESVLKERFHEAGRTSWTIVTTGIDEEATKKGVKPAFPRPRDRRMEPGSRFAPRKLRLDTLLSVLVSEHAAMGEGLRRARGAASRRDFESVTRELRDIEPMFKQHIADEESQVLGFLVSQIGRESAAEEIEVFRQHRPIYELMRRLEELAALSSAELEMPQIELQELFEHHTTAEEKGVFPKTLSLRDRARASGD